MAPSTESLLVLLGAWGGLIAFIGPYFHYAYTPDKAWTYTTGRLWLEIVPAAGAILGGLILSTSATRPSAIFGAWLAALSGAWFALGGLFSTLWSIGGTGQPVGDKLHRVVEQIGFFTGLGVVIVFLAAVALGRLTVIGARERLAAEAPAVEQVPEEEVTQPGPGAHRGARQRAGATPAPTTFGPTTPGSTVTRCRRPSPRPTPRSRRRTSPGPESATPASDPGARRARQPSVAGGLRRPLHARIRRPGGDDGFAGNA